MEANLKKGKKTVEIEELSEMDLGPRLDILREPSHRSSNQFSVLIKERKRS